MSTTGKRLLMSRVPAWVWDAISQDRAKKRADQTLCRVDLCPKTRAPASSQCHEHDAMDAEADALGKALAESFVKMMQAEEKP